MPVCRLGDRRVDVPHGIGNVLDAHTRGGRHHRERGRHPCPPRRQNPRGRQRTQPGPGVCRLVGAATQHRPASPGQPHENPPVPGWPGQARWQPLLWRGERLPGRAARRRPRTVWSVPMPWRSFACLCCGCTCCGAALCSRVRAGPREREVLHGLRLSGLRRCRRGTTASRTVGTSSLAVLRARHGDAVRQHCDRSRGHGQQQLPQQAASQ